MDLRFRQGDIEILSAKIPKDAQPQPTSGRTVLAEGEATGHAHAIRAGFAQIYLLGAVMYLRALHEAEIEHEEHGRIILPPGDYIVRRKREYDEIWGQRQVED